MPSPTVDRNIIIFIYLSSYAIQYLFRKKWLSRAWAVYTNLLLMLWILELCILQMIVYIGSFYLYIFGFFSFVSFMAFWDLLGEFISMDKKQFLRSRWFYLDTFGILVLILLHFYIFYLHNLIEKMRR